jgi:hypothetical protein
VITVLAEPADVTTRVVLAVSFSVMRADAFRRVGAQRGAEEATSTYPIRYVTVQITDPACIVLREPGELLFFRSGAPEALKLEDYSVEWLDAQVTRHGFRFTYVMRHTGSAFPQVTRWVSWTDFDAAREKMK